MPACLCTPPLTEEKAGRCQFRTHDGGRAPSSVQKSDPMLPARPPAHVQGLCHCIRGRALNAKRNSNQDFLLNKRWDAVSVDTHTARQSDEWHPSKVLFVLNPNAASPLHTLRLAEGLALGNFIVSHIILLLAPHHRKLHCCKYQLFVTLRSLEMFKFVTH